jgi:NAD(P)-dependent dehydrogenase (short-subunit alcohol dehydrogenase family)
MKKAFITGGSRGIGRGITEVLSESGYDVAFTYNTSAEEAETLAAGIKNKGGVVHYWQAELNKDGVAEDVTSKAIEALGGIDLMVCNAGRTIHHHLPQLTEEQIDYIYHLNYRSYIMCASAASRTMINAGNGGNIIFISSTRSIRAYPEDMLYGGLKSALNRSAESMAIDMAQFGIRVNVIAPGYTKVRGNLEPDGLREGSLAERIPLKRAGSPREVGYLVRYLASDEAGYITGDVIKIDGGLILPGMKE